MANNTITLIPGSLQVGSTITAISGGTALAPAFTFLGAADYGMYFDGSSVVISAAGTPQLIIDETGISEFNGSQVQFPDGTAALPAITFGNQNNTGLYRVGGDLGISVGGALVADFTPSGLTMASTSILWNADGVGDIGASGVNRPGNLFLYNNLTAGGNANITGTINAGNLNVANSFVNTSQALINVDSSTITQTSNGTYYITGVSASSNAPVISTGATNNGYYLGANLYALRANASDLGTLAQLAGVSITYGHYSGVGATASTTNAFGLQVTPLLAAGIINTSYAIYVGPAQLGATINNAHFGLYIDDQGSSNTALRTDTGKVTFGDNTTVGSAAQFAVGQSAIDTSAYVRFGFGNSGSISGVQQYGLYIDPVYTSTATTLVTGLLVKVKTAAATYTTSLATGLYIDTPLVGSGNTITNWVGVFSPGETAGTNNASFSDYNSFTGNYGLILSTTNRSLIAGPMSLGSAIVANAQVTVSPNTSVLTGTDQDGVRVQGGFDSTVATGSISAYAAYAATAATAGTVPVAVNYNAGLMVLGSGSTITRTANFFGTAQTIGETGNAFLADNAGFTGSWFINNSSTNPSYFGGTITANKQLEVGPGAGGNSNSATIGLFDSSQNGPTVVNVVNGNSGASANAQLRVTSEVGFMYMEADSIANDNVASFGAASGFAALYIQMGGNAPIIFQTNSQTALTISGSQLITAASQLQVNSNVAIGTSPDARAALFISGASLTSGTTQWGAYVGNDTTSSATTASYGVYVARRTQAASFTLPISAGFFADNGGLGAGSTVTNYVNFLGTQVTGGASNSAMLSDTASISGYHFLYQTGTVGSTLNGSLTVNNEVVIVTNNNSLTLFGGADTSNGSITWNNPVGVTSHYNWLTAAQYNVDNGWEITPSTTVNGSTFTTPVFSVAQDGDGTILRNWNVGGTTLTLNSLDVAATTSQIVVGGSDGILALAGEDGISGSGARILLYGGTAAGAPQEMRVISNGALSFDALNGGVGLGGFASSSAVVNISAGSNLSGTTQYGTQSIITFTAAATGAGNGFSSIVKTAADPYSMSVMTNFNAQTAILGTGSSVTTLVNYYSNAQTIAINNAHFADNASFSGNWFLNSTSSNPSLLSGTLSVTVTGNAIANFTSTGANGGVTQWLTGGTNIGVAGSAFQTSTGWATTDFAISAVANLYLASADGSGGRALQITSAGVFNFLGGGSTLLAIDATGAVNSNVPQTTLTGSPGSAVCSQPFQGNAYKKVIVYLSGYTDTGTQIYTFPTAFSNPPYVYGASAVVAGATVTNTTITFTITAQSGCIFIEGY